jgi:DNA repair exonuclease SbcCD ATPase subunit
MLPADLASLIAAAGGLAGLSALVKVLLDARSSANRTEAQGAEIAARAMASLQESWAGTLDRYEEGLARAEESASTLEVALRRLEFEVAAARAESQELRERLDEALTTIEAALVVLETARPHEATAKAAERVLKRPVRPRAKKPNTKSTTRSKP